MISIIVPVYKTRDYIKACLESILAQSDGDFECLLIDDGSPDDSIARAKAVIGNDERFKIYHKENGGLSDARNYGIERAKGDHVLFLDSDDEIAKDLIKEVKKEIEACPSDIIIFDLLYRYGDHDTISKGADFKRLEVRDPKEVLFINNSANNKVYTYDFIKERRFIKGMWYEDLASIPVWLAQAKRIAYIQKPLYIYNQRNDSISHTKDERIFDIFKALANIKKELGLKSEDIAALYIKNALVMNTLKIAKFTDRKDRLAYYERNMKHLNADFNAWYAYIDKSEGLKRRVFYYLLKKGYYRTLDSLLKR